MVRHFKLLVPMSNVTAVFGTKFSTKVAKLTVSAD
jgi:hypothetical protein